MYLPSSLGERSCPTEERGEWFRATQEFSGEFEGQNLVESSSPYASATRPPICSFGEHDWKCISFGFQFL